jgi:hypothetical protein
MEMFTHALQIQKGILQVCKGLSFLHTSAKLIHSNISPEGIVVNSAVGSAVIPCPASRLTISSSG